MAKYKIGDKVKVKSLDWYNQRKNSYGDVTDNHEVWFIEDMAEYCGCIMTISGVISDGYTLEEAGYVWIDNFFEGLVEIGQLVNGIDLGN